VEVFLYFFKAKQPSDRQLWVSLNGAPRRALLTLFQSSYKGFKGKFLKIRANKGDPILLDGFPLYWTPEPRFQSARRLKDLRPPDQEVCKFLSSLEVIFDTSFLLNKVHFWGSAGLHWYSLFPTLGENYFLLFITIHLSLLQKECCPA